MTKTELQERFELLGQILNLSRGLGYLNDFERMYLHQERAALMQAQEALQDTKKTHATPRYTIPGPLEAKCARVLNDFEK